MLLVAYDLGQIAGIFIVSVPSFINSVHRVRIALMYIHGQVPGFFNKWFLRSRRNDKFEFTSFLPSQNGRK